MLTIFVPADWSPGELTARDLDRVSFVVYFDPARLTSWYEIARESDGPDPRYNLSLPMGLKYVRRD